MRSRTRDRAIFVVVSAAIAADVHAQTRPSPPPDPITFQETVQVTATRFGEPVVEVPGSIAVVTGDELRARGATDLRTALAWLGGVSVAPGGDAGPADAVPGLVGVREVDDLPPISNRSTSRSGSRSCSSTAA